MPGAHVILIRHGHTSSNGGGDGDVRLSGWTDVRLSALGIREAELVARRLGSEPPLAAVYASPLRRARFTAACVAKVVGAPVSVDPDLREIGCGLADGLTVDEVRARFPQAWDANARQDDDDFRWPGGGESYREFRDRCVRSLRAIAACHRGERVAVVTHTGVITQVVGSLSGLPPARWQAYRAGNASITRLHWDGDRVRLLRFDDRDHLSPPEDARSTTPRQRAG
jgi:alpha-ribazole phosphatase/probable phosphoglycerate mutase